ncbi:PAS domain S-box protein [Haloarcula laminariae]|uniref:PAS domain S-box protein n=1 Tax=Haloarcula laminariae TaxID=2961577 RepID=UPI0021CA68DB|nr:PAS domain S-box protein [Halomicroarcula laminariae]
MMRGQPLTETLRETLALFDVAGAPLATSEVAERVGLGRRSTYERLERLVEHGRLETKKVGASGRVWWRPAPATAGGGSAGDWPAVVSSIAADVLDRTGVGVVVRDSGDHVVWVNDAAERYFGFDHDSALGTSYRTLVEEVIAPTVEDGGAFAERALAPDDTGERSEWQVTAADGREARRVEHHSEPVETGVVAGGRVDLYEDVTERARLRRAHERRERQFDSLVTAVEEYAIFKLDATGRVRTWNAGAERIKGYDAAEILGEHVGTFYTPEDRAAGVPEANLAAAAEAGAVEDEGWRLHADGSRFWANVTITAIRDDDGTLEGYAKITRDMTERREREEALRRERDLTARLFETAPVRLAVFDADGSLDRMNAESREMLGVSEDSTFSPADKAFYDADGGPLPAADHPVNIVLETGEPATDRLVGHDTPDGERRWVRLSATPLTDESGALERVIVVGEDITELKLTMRELERQRDELDHELREVFGRIDDAFFAVDEEWRFVHANEQATALLDQSVGELLGRSLWEAFPEAVDTAFQEQYERAVSTQESVTFEEYYPPLSTWFEVSAYPSESGLSVYFRDVTERREREQELEQYELAIETIGDGVYVIDEAREFVLVNEAYCELTGYDRDELLGAHVSTVAGESALDSGDRLREELRSDEESVATLATELTTADGGTVPVEARFALLDPGRAGSGSVGVVRDVTERRERERELRRYEGIVEAVEDGIYTVAEDGEFTFVNDAYGDLVGVPAAELVGRTVESLVEADILDASVIERAREIDAEIRVGERETGSIETSVVRPDGTTIRTEARFNTLATATGPERVGVVRDITDHVERQRELERQREQLAALNSLNEVVRGVTAAVIDQSSREEIEATVCEYLVDSESYVLAWVGEVDAPSETVAVRTEAGIEGYLDETVISVDPDDERSGGATGRAFLTGEMQATTAVGSDPSYDPWRDHVEQYGFQSSAAIPISHEGTMYGTLNVYAARPNAFAGQEGAVIEQLGDIVGHAIAATERKQALMSDEMVELHFLVPDVSEAFGVDSQPSGAARLRHSISLGDDEFIVYGSVTDDSVDYLRSLVDRVPHWERLTVQDGTGAEQPFELLLSAPPAFSTIASVGGSVEAAVIEDDDYRMTVHIPTSVDVRQVVERLESAYPTVQLRKRQQITRRRDASDRMQRELLADLTDRQRTVLETAYHAGFFEWPRAASGEQVASSLDIAAATFHSHMRKAQRKVFARVFTPGETAT